MRKDIGNLAKALDMGDDAVSKIFGDDDIKYISGPKTVKDLIKLLDEYRDDTHVSFDIGEKHINRIPYILKQSQNMIYMSLNSTNSECTVSTLRTALLDKASNKYLAFNFRGIQYEIGEIQYKNKLELVLPLMKWGEAD